MNFNAVNASSYNMALDYRAYRSDPPCSETGIRTVSCSQTLTGRVMRQNLDVTGSCVHKLYLVFTCAVAKCTFQDR